jgi:hypothetical protein
MYGLKKLYADNYQGKGSLSPCVLWNLLVTFIQTDMPQSRAEFDAAYLKMTALLEDLNQDKIPDPDQAFKELKSRHLVRVTKKKTSSFLADEYEEIGNPASKLKWDLKLIKNTLNFEGMGIRKQEMAICIFCASDCRSGHNFCEHLRGKSHAQKVIENWKETSEFNTQIEKNCTVCGTSAGVEEWEFEAHLRSNSHRAKLLHFIGMPYCDLCNMYLKYGMKMHQNIPLHQEMLRKNQAKKRSEGSVKEFVSQLDCSNTNIPHPDQYLKVNDPCKGGLTIRTTTGVTTEIVFDIMASGESAVEIQDIRIESNTANCSLMIEDNEKMPKVLHPCENLTIKLKMLTNETGFIRAKLHIHYSNGSQIVREIRFLSLPHITLDNLAEELQKSSINIQQLKSELENEKAADKSYEGYTLEDEEADRELMSRLSFVWES